MQNVTSFCFDGYYLLHHTEIEYFLARDFTSCDSFGNPYGEYFKTCHMCFHIKREAHIFANALESV